MTIYEKIKEFEKSKLRQQFYVGQAYYDCENIKINDRKFEVAYQNEKGFTRRYQDIWKSNNKLSTGYYPLMVDQKVDFVLSNPITFNDVAESDMKYFDNKFQDKTMDTSTTASSKGKGWAFPYIQDGVFKLQILEPDNIVAEYNKLGELIQIIKYSVQKYKEELTNQEKTMYIAEVWDDETVKVYEIKGKNETLVQEKAHMQEYIKYPNGDMIVTGENAWGRVPFIEMRNDKKAVYDLRKIKAPIDGIDLVSSDFLNNLEDFQDVYWVIKNYGGTNVDSFLKELKGLKVVKVGDGGDARPETIEIPHEARTKAIEICERFIYKFGRGVDVDKGTGGAVTNVDIKSRYQNLMSKSKRFSKQVTKFIQDYAYFAGVHAGHEIKVNPTYTYDMIINDSELAESLIKSVGILSYETIWEKHPLAAPDEAERMENQKMEQDAMYSTGEQNANTE